MIHLQTGVESVWKCQLYSDSGGGFSLWTCAQHTDCKETLGSWVVASVLIPVCISYVSYVENYCKTNPNLCLCEILRVICLWARTYSCVSISVLSRNQPWVSSTRAICSVFHTGFVIWTGTPQLSLRPPDQWAPRILFCHLPQHCDHKCIALHMDFYVSSET